MGGNWKLVQEFNSSKTKTKPDAVILCKTCKFVIRLRGPRSSIQPYIRQNSSQLFELGAQLIPSPKTIKRKNHHTCRHVLKPCHDQSCRAPYSHLSSKEKTGCCRGFPAMQADQKAKPVTAASCFNHRPISCETWKMASSSLYLDELPAIKL